MGSQFVLSRNSSTSEYCIHSLTRERTMVCSTLNRSIHQRGDEGGDMQNETGSNVKSRVPHAYALPHSQVLGFLLE